MKNLKYFKKKEGLINQAIERVKDKLSWFKSEGEKIQGGTMPESMDAFFLRTGSHWIDSRPYGCLRVNKSEECPICDYGFDMMDGVEDKETRSAIAKKLMPNEGYVVNIYFPDIKANPEKVRGKVMWYRAPYTVMKIWERILDNEDDGGDETEPQAFGIFYNPMESFLFQLEAQLQGMNNSYQTSKFITAPQLFAKPMVQTSGGEADMDAIGAIMDKRHNLFDSHIDTTLEELGAIVDKMTGKEPETKDEPKDEPSRPSADSAEAKSAADNALKSKDDNVIDDDLTELFNQVDDASADVVAEDSEDLVAEADSILDQLED